MKDRTRKELENSCKKALYRLAISKGKKAEERVFEALLKMKKKSVFLKKASRATEQQDQKGIDIVVNLDVGELFIQVKSSERQVEKFTRRHPNLSAAIIVAKEEDSDQAILEMTSDAVLKFRRRLLSEKNTPKSS